MQQKVGSLVTFLKDKPSTEDMEYSFIEEREENKKYNCPMSNRSEILSWYLYDWANSPQYNLLIGLTFPLFIYALCTEYACEYNTPNKCDVNFDPIESSSLLQISMGSWKLTPASFAFTMISLSGALQAVAYIMFGALADYGKYRYYMFRGCTLIACSMNLVFFFCWDASSYLFVGWWGAFQLVFFGLGLIYYNSQLPDIVENHWLIRRVIRSNLDYEKIAELKASIADDMSQFGYALGYCGSLFLTIVAVLIFASFATINYKELNGYGLQISSSSNITEYNEFWLKTVQSINISYTDEYIISIQLIYEDMIKDGNIYPSIQTQNAYASSITNLNQSVMKEYRISNKDHISEIHLGYHSSDNSISSIRFKSQANALSEIYGKQNGTNYEIIKADSSNFVLAGYTVYTADNHILGYNDILVVSGLDFLMINEETGQFSSTLDYRIVYLLVFCWWFSFQLCTFKYSKRRDKPPIPAHSSFMTISAKDFYSAFKEARKYPHMFRFLIAWFLYSDGLNTILTAAVLFAREELSMTQTELALLLLELLICSSVGGMIFLKIQHRFHLNSKNMILIHLSFFCFLSIYTIFGLLPGCPFGVCSKAEIYIYTIVLGANMGAIQSYSRSCFSSLIPIGMESQMFSLFEITDKGSSWMGPLMVGFIGNVTSIRWGLIYVFIFFAIPMPLLIYGVNLKKGMKAAGRAKELYEEEQRDEEFKDDSTNVGSQVIPIGLESDMVSSNKLNVEMT